MGERNAESTRHNQAPIKLPTKWPFPKETPKPLTKKQQQEESYNQAPKAPF
jgi:hypothetical protein